MMLMNLKGALDNHNRVNQSPSGFLLFSASRWALQATQRSNSQLTQVIVVLINGVLQPKELARCKALYGKDNNNQRREQEVFVSCTQWVSLPSHQVQISYDDIEYKQIMHVFFGASKRECIHHDVARRTGNRLKRRWGWYLCIQFFFTGYITFATRFCTEVSRDAANYGESADSLC
ncbi:hypothetical protein TNCV_3730041 [Trichonephila clavipes]|nr:hypothetical protein TNCV_3730041 [Trichonephila clavipes]